MEQNKIRTYLLYAIGEIALVMIGILLALQVNNWNEERKTESITTEYLMNVKQNIIADTTNSNQVYKDLYEKDLNALYLSDFLYDKNLNSDTLRLTKAFFESNTASEFTPVRLSYNAMVNTGIINNIGSEELLQLLYDYYEVDDWTRQVQQQKEAYTGELSESRFPYITKQEFREKLKTTLKWGDWKKTPEKDIMIDWEQVRDDGFYLVALDKILALNVAEFDKLEKLKILQTKILISLNNELN